MTRGVVRARRVAVPAVGAIVSTWISVGWQAHGVAGAANTSTSSTSSASPASPPPGAGQVPEGCEAVTAALARLDAQPRVVLRAEVESGRSADGVRRIALHRDGDVEHWVLDGRALREMPADGRASDAMRLAPEGACERADTADGAVLRYDAWAERGSSRITLRLDGARGLPRDALRDAPELAWGRALSRPTRPPQAALRPTGGRLVERIDFDYPAPQPRRTAMPRHEEHTPQ